VQELQFSAIGTEWSILLDEDLSIAQQKRLLNEITGYCEAFDQKYSRFVEGSWLNELKNGSGEKKTVSLNEEERELFELGLRLEQMSGHHFSLNIADELSLIGYDAQYSLREKTQPLDPKGLYWLEGSRLFLQDRVAFDLGSYGKGFLIDQIAKIISQHGLTFFLVDGSGDFWGTTKRDGSGWNIALEHPLNTSLALGVFTLKNQGFASSAPSRRRWGNKHHILDAVSGKPAQEKLSTFVAASTAMLADAFTTVLFVTPEKIWSSFHSFSYEWCCIQREKQQLRYTHSPGFDAQFFT
jgi:thiamine biosynthesis lipoprotein